MCRNGVPFAYNTTFGPENQTSGPAGPSPGEHGRQRIGRGDGDVVRRVDLQPDMVQRESAPRGAKRSMERGKETDGLPRGRIVAQRPFTEVERLVEEFDVAVDLGHA